MRDNFATEYVISATFTRPRPYTTRNLKNTFGDFGISNTGRNKFLLLCSITHHQPGRAFLFALLADVTYDQPPVAAGEVVDSSEDSIFLPTSDLT